MTRMQRRLLALALPGLFLALPLHALRPRATVTFDGSAHGTDGAHALVRDASGNFYVGGAVAKGDGTADALILKYNPAFVLTASATFNGSGNNNDQVNALTMHSNGSLLAAGYVQEPGMPEVWAAQYITSPAFIAAPFNTFSYPINAGNGSAIGMDAANNIFVAGWVSNTDIRLWLGRFGPGSLTFQSAAPLGTGGAALAAGMSVQSNGTLYLTGNLQEASGGLNILLARYSSLVWQASTTVNGSASGADAGLGVTVGPDGNVYVAGFTKETGRGEDIWVGKFDPSTLALIASTTVNGAANGDDRGNALVFGADGNLYVAGNVFSGGANTDLWLGKFDKNLALMGSSVVAGSAAGSSAGYALAADAAGNIYLAGNLVETAGGYNVVFSKYFSVDAPSDLASGAGTGTTSLQWIWSDTGEGTGYRVRTAANQDISGALAAHAASFLETGLSTNTAYGRTIEAFDGTFVEKSAVVTRYTAAAVPASAVVGGTTLFWSKNGNPAGTVFRAESSLDGSAFTEFYSGTAQAASLSGFPLGVQRHFRVRAENGNGVLTAYGNAVLAAPNSPPGPSVTLLLAIQ